MGILDRINTLIRANVNDLISRSDEPERVLDASIGDMQSSLREARVQSRRSAQQEARLVREWQRSREEALQWEDKALMALRGGDEQLARECLVIKKKEDARTARLKEDLEQQREYLADLGRSLDALQHKIDSVRSHRHSIDSHVGGGRKPHPRSGHTLPFDSDEPPARRRRDANQQPRSQGRRAFVFDDDMRRDYPEEAFGAREPFEAFDRMNERIHDMEADVEAMRDLSGRDELEDRFKRLQRERGTDAGLERLKRRAEGEDTGGGRSKPASDLRRKLLEEMDG